MASMASMASIASIDSLQSGHETPDNTGHTVQTYHSPIDTSGCTTTDEKWKVHGVAVRDDDGAALSRWSA